MEHNSSDLIYQTKSFGVERAPKPLVSRDEGGHVRIYAKNKTIRSISDLSPREAVELVRLEMVVRTALMEGMNRQGIPLVWVNMEDLGNWAFKRNEEPQFHIHVFGRAKNATKQIWPEAVSLPDRSSGFYDDFEPLTDKDVMVIRDIIGNKLRDELFADSKWSLKGN